MILNGILPIDQMRDHVPPVNLLCEYIPRHVLEDKYGMRMTKPLEGEDPDRAPHSEEFLLAHACKLNLNLPQNNPSNPLSFQTFVAS